MIQILYLKFQQLNPQRVLKVIFKPTLIFTFLDLFNFNLRFLYLIFYFQELVVCHRVSDHVFVNCQVNILSKFRGGVHYMRNWVLIFVWTREIESSMFEGFVWDSTFWRRIGAKTSVFRFLRLDNDGVEAAFKFIIHFFDCR